MSRITTLKALTALFPALLVWLLIGCPLAYAAKDAKAGKQAPDINEKMSTSQSPIYINADRMEANQEQKTIIFESNVVVRQDDTTITSNRLKVILLEGDNKPLVDDPSPAERIDYIEFEGDVKVNQLDRVATANKAIFYQREQKILLNGHPVVTKGQDRIEGNLITIYLKDGRSIVEGGREEPVKAVLFPAKKE